MGAFRFLLYAAVAVSLSVYAYRAYRKWIAPERPTEPGTDPGPPVAKAMPPAATTPRPASPPASAPADPALKAPRKRGLGFTDPTILPSTREADSSESLVQQVIRDEVARKKGLDPDAPGSADAGATTAPAGGRSGLFASAAAEPVERVSVAAALTGVRLPDDLVPLIGDADHPDPHHVLFLSASGPAGSIGSHLGDELERVGYDVRSDTDVVAVATKGQVTLRVTLHPEAGTERRDGVARFPTAAPNSVVVEFET